MILSFPSPLQKFEVCQRLAKDAPTAYAHGVGAQFTFTPPIPLKPLDFIWIDLRDGRVEMVERGGIIVWRSGWAN